MSRLDDLGRLCDRILVETVPARLRAHVDRLLARGHRPGMILACIRGWKHRDPAAVRAAEAYLESVRPGTCPGGE